MDDVTVGPRLFKIHTRGQWDASAEYLAWAPIDEADGFVHLSTEDQVKQTAHLHFNGRRDLVLVEIDGSDLAQLRFEPSRDGELFPHVYGAIPRSAVKGSWPLPWDPNGGSFVWPPQAALG